MSIISHKHKFIFLKSRKTAGTSVSAVLAKICGDDDILALSKDVIESSGLQRKNINIPLSSYSIDVLGKHTYRMYSSLVDIIKRNKSFSDIELLPTFKQHMSAMELKNILGESIWNNYYKFTIERNPFDRLVSFYKWRTHRFNIECSFNDFALSTLGYNNKLSHITSGFSNIHFYSFDKKNICVDRVLAFEDIEVELIRLLNDLDLNDQNKIELPMLKAGIREDRRYRVYYSDTLRDMAEESFKVETKLFGYTF